MTEQAEKRCCPATRLDEAGDWIDTVADLQAQVARLSGLEERRTAMLALHKGWWSAESQSYRCRDCGDWPCATYLACYPEQAWS